MASHRQFCVAVSGFKVAGPLSAALFSEGYVTPTLHVLGKNDILVIEERSRVLINVSKTKRVEMHDGGAQPPPCARQEFPFHIWLFIKVISCRPRQAGGHSSRLTCSIQRVTCPARDQLPRRNLGQGQSHHSLDSGLAGVSRTAFVPQVYGRSNYRWETM